jgi:hypothetical protein
MTPQKTPDINYNQLDWLQGVCKLLTLILGYHLGKKQRENSNNPQLAESQKRNYSHGPSSSEPFKYETSDSSPPPCCTVPPSLPGCPSGDEPASPPPMPIV